MMTYGRTTTQKPKLSARGVLGRALVAFILLQLAGFDARAVTNVVSVMWNTSLDPAVAGYAVYYGNASGNYSTRIDAGTNTTMVVSNLQGGLTYYFVATAYNSALVEGPPSNEAQFTVSANATPVVISISNQYVSVEQMLVITNGASETGETANQLTYRLAAGAPSQMSINPRSGVVHWLVPFSAAGLTNPVTVQVTDGQTPPTSAATTFNVVVANAAQLSFGPSITAAGATGSVTITLASSIALTNLTFTLTTPTGRVSNVTVASVAPTVASVTQKAMGANGSLVTVSGINGQALPTGAMLQINFTAVAGQHSAFVDWQASNVSATQANGAALPTVLGGDGRTVLIGPEPLVDAFQTNGQRTLVLYGNVGSHYVVQSTTSTKAPSVWATAFSGTLTNLSLTFPGVAASSSSIFYRAYTY
jgi:hypothetical protein